MIPASAAQQRMLFLNEVIPTKAMYNTSTAFRLTGRLHPTALGEALNDITARHEALRTVFPADGGGSYQRIIDPADVPAVLRVLTEIDEDVQAILDDFAASAFELTSELPIRALLVSAGTRTAGDDTGPAHDSPGDYIFQIVIHHIAVDQASVPIVLRDLGYAYAARAAGSAPRWYRPAPGQSRFTRWQDSSLGTRGAPREEARADLAFWRQRLDGLPACWPLPTDHPRPAEPSGRGSLVSAQIPERAIAGLRSLAEATGTTTFMLLAAAVAALLSRLGGGADIAVGTPVTLRTRTEFEDVVGLLTNMVAIRIDDAAQGSFTDLVARTRDSALEAFGHSSVPFEQVVTELKAGGARNANPVFQVLLAVETAKSAVLELPGLTVEPLSRNVLFSRFDLAFYLGRHVGATGEPGVRVDINYATDLFERPTAQRLAERLVSLLTTVADDPGAQLAELNLLLPDELTAIDEWGAAVPIPAASSVMDLFERQARCSPGAPAVASSSGVLSYAALDRAAGLVANRLAALGTGPDSIVAVILPRSPAMITAMLGVLKAGAAYLPIEPDQPVDRTRFMLADARPACVLTSSDFVPQVAGAVPDALLIDDLLGSHPSQAADAGRPSAEPNPLSAAYVLYTSGSTGRPKGVVVTRGGLANYVREMASSYPGLQGHTILHTSTSFDFSGTAIFGALASGGCVHVGALDELELRAAQVESVDFLKVTPSQIMMLERLPDRYAPTKELMLGGEALWSEAIKPWLKTHDQVRLVNHYGPTETTVAAIHFCLEPGQQLSAGRVPIGRPMTGVRAYVLDRSLRPQPRGVPGELYLAGAGLARGYLARPGLTAQRFVADPFGPPGNRMYRTGDLARQRADGLFEFLQRTDKQVKIRGFRVETGEIEHALADLPGVAGAAVAVRRLAGQAERLVGYVTPSAGATLTEPDIRSLLARRLPGFMVPSAIVIVPAFPLTHNGKVDRAALPDPDSAGSRAAPRSEQASGLAATVAGIFSEFLNLPSIKADDDFFALGGDSISAFAAVHRIRELVWPDLPLRLMLTNPTPASLAAAIGGAGAQPASPVPISTLPIFPVPTTHRPVPRLSTAHVAAPMARTFTAGQVLLTGATGFFGAFVLAELLASTDATVHCLVRSESQEQGRQRIDQAVSRYQLGQPVTSDRVRVVVGDLDRPHLGLDDREYDELSNSTDVIVHAAANVNAFLPLERLHDVNVSGTGQLIGFARRAREKTLHFVSTTSVMTSADWSGYAVSKREAEDLVFTEQLRGLSATVSRLPRLSPAASTGAANENDLMHRVLRSMLMAGLAPDIDVLEVWIPVDRAALAFVATAFSEHVRPRVVYASDELFSLRECLLVASDRGFSMTFMPFDRWEELMRRSGDFDSELAASVLGRHRSRHGHAPRADRLPDAFEYVLVPGPDSATHRQWLDRLAADMAVGATEPGRSRG